MSAEFVLGIDLGTSSCKACLVDAGGRVSARGRAGYHTHAPRSGWTEQEPADWFPAVRTAVRQALAGGGGPSVRAVGLSSAAHIGVLLDGHDEPVRRSLLWSDQRSGDEASELESTLGQTIFGQTRNRVATTWTLPHLLWISRNDPNAWRRVRRILLSKDYILWRLTGCRATDKATAVSSMLFDAQRGRWSDELCGAAGVRRDMLPEVMDAAAACGGLRQEAAAELGLRGGTPVVVGTLDSAAELCGAGVTSPGEALVRLATAGGVEVVSAAPQPHRQLISYPHPLPPLWYNQAGTSSCGAAVDWAARALGGGSASLAYAELDRLAEKAPAGAGGTTFHPYLAGERCPHWDPKLRGSFVGLGLEQDASHLARAVLEGVSYSIRDALLALPSPVFGDEPLKVVGGGTNSRIWIAILSSVLDRPLAPVPDADSCAGAALIALASVEGADLAHVCRRAAARGAHAAPDAAWVSAYAAGFARYRLVAARLREVYDRD